MLATLALARCLSIERKQCVEVSLLSEPSERPRVQLDASGTVTANADPPARASACVSGMDQSERQVALLCAWREPAMICGYLLNQFRRCSARQNTHVHTTC